MNMALNPPSDDVQIHSDETTKDDILDFLNEDSEGEKTNEKPEETEEKEVKEAADEEVLEEKESEEKEPEEDDEIKAIEEELEEPDEEKLELTTPVRRREILSKYPNLFKDFPYLEKAYYREQQYTEILPSIDDAKVAVEKAQTLDNFEKELMNGSTESIIKAVKENDSQAFSKIVDDYLPTLARVDQQAFHHVIGNVIKHTIMSMVNESKTNGNEALGSAAVLLNQFVFGTSNFIPPNQLSKPDDTKPEKDKLERERQDFVRQRFESVRDDLSTRVNNALKSTIEQHIDPKSSMTDYIKKNASREAMETLASLIDRDTRFRVILDKLWEKAFQSNFNKDSVDRIRSAYFSKAKTLLPSVIKKARNDALRGLGKKSSNEEESDRKGPLPVGKTTAPRGKISSPKQIPAGMRTIDFFMQD
jgi:hypothetical protein